MTDRNGLERFSEAQNRDYEAALNEIREGYKRTHWIWYIFPQMYGLGHSYYSKFYGIVNRQEAEAYLADPVLGARLREITAALLSHEKYTAREILGHVDALKVRSCMTLFDSISSDDIFDQVLRKYYDGTRCQATLRMLGERK